jgi:hypothetical protein
MRLRARGSIPKPLQKRDQSVQTLSRSLHCNGSIHSYRSIVCWRKHGFVGENYISPVTIHIILSKCEPIEPSFTAALPDLSPSSVMRFLKVLGQPEKAVLRFSWTELRNRYSRASSTYRTSSALDDTCPNPVPVRILVSPLSRYQSIHLLAVLSGTPYRLPASDANGYTQSVCSLAASFHIETKVWRQFSTYK